MGSEHIVRVDLGERSYDIHIGPGLLVRAGELVAPALSAARLFIVTHPRLARLGCVEVVSGTSEEELRRALISLGARE